MSEWPNEVRVQVSNLLNCTIIYEGDVTAFLDIDDLAMVACALLDQFCERGIPDAIQRRVVSVENTLEANNQEKLKDLVTNFTAVIHAHDAKVAASQAALSAHESLAVEPVDGMHASFPASPSFSTEIPSSGATTGNTNGVQGNTNANLQLGAVDVTSRCTIQLSRPHNKGQRQYQEAHTVTLVAAALAFTGPPGRPLGGGAEGRRRRVLQGSVWGAAGQGINGHAEAVVGGAVLRRDRHVLAARIHCGGRDVEGGG